MARNFALGHATRRLGRALIAQENESPRKSESTIILMRLGVGPTSVIGSASNGGQCDPGKEVVTMGSKIGRSAITGRYMPVWLAQVQKNTSVVETIKPAPKKGK